MADDPVAHLVADLHRDASATTVRMAGLDERAIAALLEALAGHSLDKRAAELVPVLQSETGGNPFFIREVLAHLVESEPGYRAPATAGPPISHPRSSRCPRSFGT